MQALTPTTQPLPLFGFLGSLRTLNGRLFTLATFPNAADAQTRRVVGKR